MDIGIIERQNGGVDIVRPADGFTVQDNFDRMQTTGIIVDISAIPSTRIFRNAWVMNQAGTGVMIDLQKAKNIAIDRVKEIVDKQLKAIRPSWEEAVDNDDTVLMDQIKSDRRNIRSTLDAKIQNINNCTTVAEVESYLP
jgi:hypothetical protein